MIQQGTIDGLEDIIDLYILFTKYFPGFIPVILEQSVQQVQGIYFYMTCNFRLSDGRCEHTDGTKSHVCKILKYVGREKIKIVPQYYFFAQLIGLAPVIIGMLKLLVGHG